MPLNVAMNFCKFLSWISSFMVLTFSQVKIWGSGLGVHESWLDIEHNLKHLNLLKKKNSKYFWVIKDQKFKFKKQGRDYKTFFPISFKTSCIWIHHYYLLICKIVWLFVFLYFLRKRLHVNFQITLKFI